MYSTWKVFSVKLAERQKPVGVRNLPQDNLVPFRSSKKKKNIYVPFILFIIHEFGRKSQIYHFNLFTYTAHI